MDTPGRTPLPVRRGERLGVRLHEPEHYRHIARIAGTLYAAIGLDIILLGTAAYDWIDHPTPYLGSGGVILAVGLTMVVLGFTLPDRLGDQIYVPAAHLALFGGATAASVILWLVGFAEFAIGAVAYLIVLVFGFYILARWAALLLLGYIAVAHAALVVASPDVNAPVQQWIWLMVILVAAAVLVGGMVQEIEDAQEEERAARQQLAVLNEELSGTVAAQVTELERLGQLRRFLPAPVADTLLATGDESLLAAHRREIAVIFCDLRGFTAFSRQVEPEEVIGVLDAYYKAVGERFDAYHATVGAYEGDGVMAFLNDPYRCEEPALRVVELARDVGKVMDDLTTEWQARDYDLGYGIGIAMGHATLGLVGFEGRTDYTALGNVVNLAARLCAIAGRGQVVVDRRVQLQVRHEVDLIPLSPVELKGFAEPVPVYELPRG